MTEKIKFTDSEIEEINNLRIEVGKVFTQMGSIQIEKRKQIAEFEQIENSLLQQHSELAVKEEILFKSFIFTKFVLLIIINLYKYEKSSNLSIVNGINIFFCSRNKKRIKMGYWCWGKLH